MREAIRAALWSVRMRLFATFGTLIDWTFTDAERAEDDARDAAEAATATPSPVPVDALAALVKTWRALANTRQLSPSITAHSQGVIDGLHACADELTQYVFRQRVNEYTANLEPWRPDLTTAPNVERVRKQLGNMSDGQLSEVLAELDRLELEDRANASLRQKSERDGSRAVDISGKTRVLASNALNGARELQ